VCLRCATSTRPEPFARPLFDGELTAELVLNLGSGPNVGRSMSYNSIGASVAHGREAEYCHRDLGDGMDPPR
jgi:hypothetical protein